MITAGRYMNERHHVAICLHGSTFVAVLRSPMSVCVIWSASVLPWKQHYLLLMPFSVRPTSKGEQNKDKFFSRFWPTVCSLPFLRFDLQFLHVRSSYRGKSNVKSSHLTLLFNASLKHKTCIHLYFHSYPHSDSEHLTRVDLRQASACIRIAIRMTYRYLAYPGCYGLHTLGKFNRKTRGAANCTSPQKAAHVHHAPRGPKFSHRYQS